MTVNSEAAPRLRSTWCGRTATGQVRKNNEDTLWAAPLGAAEIVDGDTDGQTDTRFPGLLLAVADGIGGEAAGEVASGLAVRTIASEMARRVRDLEPWPTKEHRSLDTLKAAVEAADVCIRGEGESNPQRTGMGTTLTAVWICGEVAHIAQVGDSRAYLFRGGTLRQLTKDQTWVGKLLEAGIITEEEAPRVAMRHVLLQALGSEEPIEVVQQTERVEPGDLFLLCTDGLCGVVANPEIEDVLQQGGTPEALCGRLIELAESHGSPDNVTVLLARLQRLP